MTLFGWIFAEIYFRNKPDDFYSFRSDIKEEETANIDDDSNLPGTLASLLPLLVPIVLILSKTTCDMICPEGTPVLLITSFVGDSNIALAIGAVLAIVTLGKRLGSKKVLEVMDKTLKDAGPIVFITAAGGALGQVLKVSGACLLYTSQTRERAVALEVRGFNSRTPKTFINQMEDGSHDRFIRSCCCVLVIAALVWRGFLWLR